MAKRGKYHKASAFAFDGLDVRHYRTTEAYARAVATLFDRATVDVTTQCANIKPGNNGFSFADYPSAAKHMEKVCAQLTSNVTATITRGSRKEWLFACDKNNEFLQSIMNTSKVRPATLKRMQDRNLDALQAFQARKIRGMDLSRRVWSYVDGWKDHMELALDAGLGNGKSSAELARQVKQDLKYPDKLFRRVRDKDGNLRLSKNAAAFHPGQGVYRSSVKNAQRLTRSEINMAYRESDFLRWQQLDFVVGFEIKRSNHQPEFKCALCERLKGRYPKTFKFVGWHPQCMCKAVPILMDDETFDANELGELRAALKGEEYHAQQAKNVVTDVPDGFKELMAEMAEKQANWTSTPYFIRDNFEKGLISEGLKIKLPSVAGDGKVSYHLPFEQLSSSEKNDWQNVMSKYSPVDYEWESALRLYSIDVQPYIDAMNEAIAGSQYWRAQEIITEHGLLDVALKNAIVRAKQQAQHVVDEYVVTARAAEVWIGRQSVLIDYIKQCMINEQSEKYPNYISILKSADGGSLDVSKLMARVQNAEREYNDAVTQAKTAIANASNNKDTAKLERLLNETLTAARPAINVTPEIVAETKRISANGLVSLKTKYDTNADVDETFKALNDALPDGEKWFEHGDCQMAVETNPRNNGSTNMRGKIWLTSTRLADSKSALGKIGQGKPDDITFDEADAMATLWHEIMHNRNKPGNMYITDTQRRAMELANEYTARHSLPEFYAALGVKDMPHKEFITNRSSTGYNRMVLAYQHVVKRMGLDEIKVMASVRKWLFEKTYDTQNDGLTQALIDGGLKRADGKKASKLASLMKLVRDGWGESTIDDWLKQNGYLTE